MRLQRVSTAPEPRRSEPSLGKVSLEAAGKITREIFAFPGGRRFHFKDPAGNELAVWSDKD